MNPKDQELENLLKPLKDLNPTDLQQQSWKRSIPRKTSFTSQYFKVAVALFIGFVLGGVVVKTLGGEGQTFSAISSNDATFEHSHSNLD
ncbi:MAG: hypothetical protein H7326_05445 [Bdellovibrionaceae bacterium]|nr:hypothetical protein [Pseudobdellovibrionaceae bacterium]